MTHQEIIEMAREAAARHGHTLKDEPSPETVEFIVELVTMAAAKEREACAALCDDLQGQGDEGWQPDAADCANAIRARGIK